MSYENKSTRPPASPAAGRPGNAGISLAAVLPAQKAPANESSAEINPPQASDIAPFQLKQHGDQLQTARRLAVPPVFKPLGSGATVQRVIDAKKKEYVTGKQLVTHIKFGKGTITAIQGGKYVVNFGGRTGSKTVPADQLSLAEAEEEEKNTDAPKPGDEGNEPQETVSGQSQISEEAIAVEDLPKFISIAQAGSKKWTITLLNEGGQEMAQMEEVGVSEVKPIVNGPKCITAEKMTTVKAGKFNLKPDAVLVGRLQQGYEKYIAAKNNQAKLERLSRERAVSTGEAPVKLSQQEIIKRLQALQSAKKNTESGHVSIMMTKIRLDNPITIIVGGQARVITHLYTQPGNETEIRCYLGNADGAYQRVHTSLTADAESTAHTMVQTGDEVTVPQIKPGGRRIGFDTSEQQEKGFATRPKKIRSTKQCTVKDWISADDFGKLSPDQQNGCILIADRFNQALDKVCADVNKGTPEEREVTGITSDFKVLDDEWLFDSGKAATPQAEWAHQNETAKAAKTPEEEHQPNSTLTSGYEGPGVHKTGQDVTKFKTWAEAGFSLLHKGQLIKITQHEIDISDRIFMVTEDYNPSHYEVPPDKLPVKWIN